MNPILNEFVVLQEQHIGELQRLIKRYKRIEEMVLSSAGKKALELEFGDEHSDSSSHTQHSAGSSGDRQQVGA